MVTPDKLYQKINLKTRNLIFGGHLITRQNDVNSRLIS